MKSARYVAEINDNISVVLRKSGKHFIGLCPFHEEKTGSFLVHNTERKYYCFGCGKSGYISRDVYYDNSIEIIEVSDLPDYVLIHKKELVLDKEPIIVKLPKTDIEVMVIDDQ